MIEPTSAYPPSSSLPKIARNSKSRKSDRQKTWQNILGRSDKNTNGQNTTAKKAINTGSGHNSKQHVNMKVVDDKLKIIDDVPNSAVEMAVKEKFLKKVQKQDRIVEEIKTVLKPYYNRKKITKL